MFEDLPGFDDAKNPFGTIAKGDVKRCILALASAMNAENNISLIGIPESGSYKECSICVKHNPTMAKWPVGSVSASDLHLFDPIAMTLPSERERTISNTGKSQQTACLSVSEITSLCRKSIGPFLHAVVKDFAVAFLSAGESQQVAVVPLVALLKHCSRSMIRLDPWPNANDGQKLGVEARVFLRLLRVVLGLERPYIDGILSASESLTPKAIMDAMLSYIFALMPIVVVGNGIGNGGDHSVQQSLDMAVAGLLEAEDVLLAPFSARKLASFVRRVRMRWHDAQISIPLDSSPQACKLLPLRPCLSPAFAETSLSPCCNEELVAVAVSASHGESQHVAVSTLMSTLHWLQFIAIEASKPDLFRQASNALESIAAFFAPSMTSAASAVSPFEAYDINGRHSSCLPSVRAGERFSFLMTGSVLIAETMRFSSHADIARLFVFYLRHWFASAIDQQIDASHVSGILSDGSSAISWSCLRALAKEGIVGLSERVCRSSAAGAFIQYQDEIISRISSLLFIFNEGNTNAPLLRAFTHDFLSDSPLAMERFMQDCYYRILPSLCLSSCFPEKSLQLLAWLTRGVVKGSPFVVPRIALATQARDERARVSAAATNEDALSAKGKAPPKKQKVLEDFRNGDLIASLVEEDRNHSGVELFDSFFAAPEAHRQCYLSRFLSSKVAHTALIIARLCSTPSTSVLDAQAVLRMLIDHLPPTSKHPIPFAFQQIMEKLVWQLADDPFDSPHNRAADALRKLAHALLGEDSSRPSSTFPLKRVQAAPEILRQLIRDLEKGRSASPNESTIGDSSSFELRGGPPRLSSMSLAKKASSVLIFSLPEPAPADLRNTAPRDPLTTRLFSEYQVITRALWSFSSDAVSLSDAQAVAFRDATALLQMPMEILLQRHFLLLLSTLTAALTGPSNHVAVKRHALLVLQRIIVRMGCVGRLDKHVPSVTAFFRSACAASVDHPELQVLACAVLDTFVRTLQPETLRTYLSTIVVSLDAAGQLGVSSGPQTSDSAAAPTAFSDPDVDMDVPDDGPSMQDDERFFSALSKAAESTAEQDNNMIFYSSRVAVQTNRAYETFCARDYYGIPVVGPSPVASSKTGKQPVRGPLWNFHAASSVPLDKKVYEPFGGRHTVEGLINRTLHYLFVERKAELSGVFPEIPAIFEITCLQPFRSLIHQVVGTPTPETRLLQLLPLVRHDVEGVQYLALREIYYVLRANEKLMYSLILTHSADLVAPIVSDIMNTLLEVNRRSPSPRVRQTCGCCLGQLCAIDPARMPGFTKQEQPGELQQNHLLIELIRNYLVKCIRAASDTREQGVYAYALQEVVKLYGTCRAPQHVSSEVHTNNASSSTSSVGSSALGGISTIPSTYPDEKTGSDISYQGDRSTQGGAPQPMQLEGWLKSDLGHLQAMRSAEETALGLQPAASNPNANNSPMLEAQIKELMEVIQPYWHSQLRLKDAARSQFIPKTLQYQSYFASEQKQYAMLGDRQALVATANHFNRWIGHWCQYLIDQRITDGNVNERDKILYEGCRPILDKDTPTALFLLPYLIRDSARLGSAQAHDNIVTEILSVLQGEDTLESKSPDVSGSRNAASSQFPARATQAVFSLIDTLQRWISRAADTPDPKKDGLVLLLRKLPASELSVAAFRVHAPARAFMYLETSIRATYGGELGSARIQDVLEDGALGGLVSGSIKYRRNELAQLQQIYAQLDEPDGMSGIGALRSRLLSQNSSFSSSAGQATTETLSALFENTVDFQHNALWTDALMCYEQMLQIMQKNPRQEQGNQGAEEQEMDEHDGAGLSHNTDLSLGISEGDVHAGLLQCLRNVGHFETALNRAVGVLGRRPDLSPSLTPHAVEAAWRLGQWDCLKDLLSFDAHAAQEETENLVGLPLNGTRSHLKDGNILPDFQTALGSSLLSLQGILKSAADAAKDSAIVNLWKDTSTGNEAGALDAAVESPSLCSYKGTVVLAVKKILDGATFRRSVPQSPLLSMQTCMSSWLFADPVIETLGMSLLGVNTKMAPSGRRNQHASASLATYALPSVRLSDSLKDSVTAARKDVMASLASASMESYNRAYPYLVRLHLLREIEFAASVTDGKHVSMADSLLDTCDWQTRLHLTTPSLGVRDQLLAVRRALFRLFGAQGEEAQGWIELAKATKAAGNIPAAFSAVLQAASLGNKNASFYRAKLLYSLGEYHRAILELEPVEIDLRSLNLSTHADSTPTTEIPPDRFLLAKKILYVTNWKVEFRLIDEAEALRRYQAVARMCARWEKAHFYLARFYDNLFRVMLRDDPCPPPAKPADLPEIAATKTRTLEAWRGRRDQLVLKAIQHYGFGAAVGHAFIFHAMPRMLTLYFDYGAATQAVINYTRVAGATRERQLRERDKEKAAQQEQVFINLARVTKEICDRTGMAGPFENTFKHCGDAMTGHRRSIGYARWLTVISQLASRICHRHPDAADWIMRVLETLLYTFPQQAGWTLVGLVNSSIRLREKRASEVFSRVERQFPQIARDIRALRTLCTELIRIARDPLDRQDPKVKEYDVDLGEGTRQMLKEINLILPLQSSLSPLLGKGAAGSHGGYVDEASLGPPRNAPYILRFDRRGEVMLSKEKPKRITICASDGRRYNFLCKQEKKGDLRKDSRMMETAALMNRLFSKDSEGRRRKLRLRTYAVICLNEDSGMMQWVPNTAGFRGELTKVYVSSGLPSPMLTARYVREFYEWLQKPLPRGPAPEIRIPNKVQSAVAGVPIEIDNSQVGEAERQRREDVSRFRREILPHFPAVFHKWFTGSFPDPTTWFDARITYTRSAASWSMVGHVLGLGDRHGENILLDKTSGECCHVDFDCLFDKGLTLPVPEVVPFRLTNNMLDAMGLSGYEGVFRRVAEIAMHALRTHKDMLLSLLESFVHDPLVEWSRQSGRSSRVPLVAPVPGTASRREDAIVADTQNGGESSNPEGVKMIKEVMERLDGFYNAGTEAIRRKAMAGPRGVSAGGSAAPLPPSSNSSGAVGSSTGQALSIAGQVHRLIREATLDENLMKMYIGWMPFL
jgi:tetratricopeptide (TPR) repeat protein